MAVQNVTLKNKESGNSSGDYGSFSLFTFRFSLRRGFTQFVPKGHQWSGVSMPWWEKYHAGGVIPSGRTGFTLLETVVAFGIILAAVAGPVSLVINAFGTFGTSRNKLIAANLAEEGIELVRLIRDQNILCDYVRKQINPSTPEWRWNYRPDNGTGEAIADNDYFLAADSFAPIAAANCGSIQSPSLSSFTGQKLNLAGSFYGVGAGTETLFERKVRITFAPSDADAGVPSTDQTNIIATVTWPEKGGARQVILKNRLYNWR